MARNARKSGRRLRTVLVAGAVLVPVLAGSAYATRATTEDAKRSGYASCLNGVEREFLTLINNYRKQHGKPVLKASKALNRASYFHGLDMGKRNYFSHDTPEGKDPWKRMAEQGYDYSTAKAENIAAGNASAKATFEQWRTSAGHNANMLNGDLRAIGIGRAIAPGSKFRYYWVNTFGGQVDAAPKCG